MPAPMPCEAPVTMAVICWLLMAVISQEGEADLESAALDDLSA